MDRWIPASCCRSPAPPFLGPPPSASPSLASSMCIDFRQTAAIRSTVPRAMEMKRAPYDVDNHLRKMCESGHIKDAVNFFQLIHKGGLNLVPKNYAFLLQECAKVKALDEGQKIHALLCITDMKVDVSLMNNLLSMYIKCGCLKEAKVIFNDMGRTRDVVTWTLMIDACVQRGHVKEAIKLFFMMLKRKVKPNKITFVRLLKACSVPEALDDGKRIHKHASRRNLETNMYVGAALMEMYIKCGSIKEARKVFLGIFPKDSSVWSLMLSGYVQNGLFHETLKAFQHMRWKYGIQPTPTLWITALNACGNIADLEYGKLLHACINESYYELDGCVLNELVQMYIKCGSLADACALFERCLAPPVSLWISLISACKEAGNNEQASKLSFQLEQSGVSSMQPSSPYNAYVDSIQCEGVFQTSGEVQKLASDTVQTCLPLAATKHSLYPESSMMH